MENVDSCDWSTTHKWSRSSSRFSGSRYFASLSCSVSGIVRGGSGSPRGLARSLSSGVVILASLALSLAAFDASLEAEVVDTARDDTTLHGWCWGIRARAAVAASEWSECDQERICSLLEPSNH